MDLYFNYATALLITILADAAGWSYGIITRQHGWFKLNLMMVVFFSSIKALLLGVMFKVIPGSTSLFIILSMVIFSLSNPHYIMTAGMVVSHTPHTKKHRNYYYLLGFEICLFGVGVVQYLITTREIPLELIVMLILTTYAVMVVPVRQMIIFQQTLYSFKGVVKDDDEKKDVKK